MQEVIERYYAKKQAGISNDSVDSPSKLDDKSISKRSPDRSMSLTATQKMHMEDEIRRLEKLKLAPTLKKFENEKELEMNIDKPRNLDKGIFRNMTHSTHADLLDLNPTLEEDAELRKKKFNEILSIYQTEKQRLKLLNNQVQHEALDLGDDGQYKPGYDFREE